jgi:hypothetical protein
MQVVNRVCRWLGPQRFQYAYLPGILLIASTGLLFEQKVPLA